MDTKYWEMSKEELFTSLKTSNDGLSFKEVSQRQKLAGKNELISAEKKGAIKIFLSQFSNPLLIVLIFASLVSGYLGDSTSAIIIFLIIISSSFISFFQEYRSEKTTELLKKKIALKSRVIRNGKIQTVLAHDLVVGDIVLLSFGNIVSADLRIIETEGISINESSLTGESFPVNKSCEPEIQGEEQQLSSNAAFMGTYVLQGTAKGIVVAIGRDTKFGKIVDLVSSKKEMSQFQKGIAEFSFFLFKIVVLFSLVVFMVLSLLKGNWLESLLFALSVAVGISPELLPIIITMNLSAAARKLAKKNILVRRLMCIEDLGSVDILCTDKTGTLTEGEIFLEEFSNYSEEKDYDVLKYAYLCRHMIKDATYINPLDRAISKYVESDKKLLNSFNINDLKVIEEIPFDFDRRKSSVVVKDKKTTIITKGAEEEMLASCKYIIANNRKCSIEKYLKDIREQIRKREKNGFKVLIVGTKQIADKDAYGFDDENDLIFQGYLVFSDPPQKTAAEFLKSFVSMGVSIKLLTGDTEETAKFLARKVGIDYNAIILGSKIEKMSDEELLIAVKNYEIFAKTTPELKLRIVQALKRSGRKIAFMGDGINDAPALQAADVGISVDSATDVAKEAADVILLKHNLEVLIDGIKEGRKAFGNTIKYISCTISSNYGNMFSVVIASFFMPFIPLLPAQVLLLNFLTDFPLLMISTDNVDDEYMKKPNEWNIEKIKKSMNYFGLVSSFFDFVTFGFLLFIIQASAPLFQAGWFWQSCITEIFLIFSIRTKGLFWKSKPSKYLLWASFFTLSIVVFIIYSSIAGYFGFAIMPLWINAVLLIIGLLYLGAIEVGKQYYVKKRKI